MGDLKEMVVSTFNRWVLKSRDGFDDEDED